VDVFDYYASCENITTSDGGADRTDDDAYYELMRASADGYSTAGAIGNYVYHAKLVSSEIEDVVANSPSPGEVRLYILMENGEIAGEEVKQAVLNACNADTVRPMTDHVLVENPEEVLYDIDFTYWVGSDQTVGSAEIQSKVDAAVQEYIQWQRAKLGLDINPSKLIGLLMQTGIKRVELRSPSFTALRSGKLTMGRTYEYADTVPQIAAIGDVSAVSGGYEDE
jgi:phage-related baseplate assembly protein